MRFAGSFLSGRLVRDKRVLISLNALLGFLLAAAVLFSVRDVTSTLLAPKAKPQKEVKKTQSAAKRSFTDYAQILKKNPFGFQAGELTPLSGAQAAQGATPIDLSLIGTVAGPSKHSYAIFSDKAGIQEVFSVGESVFGTGTLKKVEKDSVLISSGGKEIEVKIADVAMIEIGKTASGTPTTFARRTGETTYNIDQKRVQQAIDNPRQIMTDARLVPNMVDGAQQGFVISEVKPAGIYQSLGLQNGDVLLRINEFNISSAESALQAFTALKGMDRIQLDIMRAGAKMTMTYQIK